MLTNVGEIRGNIPQIVCNKADLYEGNLKHYFRVIFLHAQNLAHPYHNLRHMLHVMWLCYQACVFYGDRLTPREKRNLLIAALFHDFDHSGLLGYDDLNIERAIRGLQKYILDEDKPFIGLIIQIIHATQFPYIVPTDDLKSLGEKIIRDADLSQVLNTAWIQHVVIGLAQEWNKSPIQILEAQVPFCKNVRYSTKWAQKTFNDAIAEKVQESRELLEILKEG